MSDSATETSKHIRNVQYFLQLILEELLKRFREHDKTKLEDPEKEVMDVFTPKLKGLTYMSDEYKKCLEEMKKTGFLEHHYAKNRHHPEYFGAQGINGMNLMDLVEMICDWKAASMRHADGDPMESLKENIKRFNIDPQLAQILKNTLGYFSFHG